MKKTVYCMMAAGLLAAVACRQKEMPAADLSQVRVYHAGIEEKDTKTTLYGNRSIYWESTDVIYVSVGGSYTAYTYQSGKGKLATFTYAGGGTEDEGKPAFYGVTVSGEASETVLWEGTCVLGNWGGYIHENDMNAHDWSQVAPGTKLCVAFTTDEGKEADGYQLGFQNSSWGNMEHLGYPSFSAGDTYYEVALDQETLDEIAADGIIVKGKNMTVTKIYLKASSAPVTLPAEYEWSAQGYKAPMIDPDANEGNAKFSMMGAVLKVDVANIPSAADKLVFTATGKNISGAYAVTSGELVLTEGENNTVTIGFAAGAETNRTFFIPLPTGTYGSCNLSIKSGEDVLLSKKIPSGALVLARGDLLYVPGISASDYSLRSVIWEGTPGEEREDKYIENSDFGWEQIAVGDVIRFTLGHDGDLELYYADAGWQDVKFVNTNLKEAGFYDLAVTQEVRDHLMINKRMRVVSNYSQLSRMEWLSPASPETVLWSGTHNLKSDGNFEDLQLPGFWTAMNTLEGKVVTIYYEDCIDGTDKGEYNWIGMDVKNPEGWTSYYNGGHNSGGVGVAGSCTMEITSAIATILKTSGMYIAGDNVNLTKITLK